MQQASRVAAQDLLAFGRPSRFDRTLKAGQAELVAAAGLSAAHSPRQLAAQAQAPRRQGCARASRLVGTLR